MTILNLSPCLLTCLDNTAGFIYCMALLLWTIRIAINAVLWLRDSSIPRDPKDQADLIRNLQRQVSSLLTDVKRSEKKHEAEIEMLDDRCNSRIARYQSQQRKLNHLTESLQQELEDTKKETRNIVSRHKEDLARLEERRIADLARQEESLNDQLETRAISYQVRLLEKDNKILAVKKASWTADSKLGATEDCWRLADRRLQGVQQQNRLLQRQLESTKKALKEAKVDSESAKKAFQKAKIDNESTKQALKEASADNEAIHHVKSIADESLSKEKGRVERLSKDLAEANVEKERLSDSLEILQTTFGDFTSAEVEAMERSFAEDDKKQEDLTREDQERDVHPQTAQQLPQKTGPVETGPNVQASSTQIRPEPSLPCAEPKPQELSEAPEAPRGTRPRRISLIRGQKVNRTRDSRSRSPANVAHSSKLRQRRREMLSAPERSTPQVYPQNKAKMPVAEAEILSGSTMADRPEAEAVKELKVPIKDTQMADSPLPDTGFQAANPSTIQATQVLPVRPDIEMIDARQERPTGRLVGQEPSRNLAQPGLVANNATFNAAEYDQAMKDANVEAFMKLIESEP